MLRGFRTNQFRRLGKEFAWIALGQAATVLGALLGIRILTELLSPSEYGQLTLGMTLATLVQTVVLGPLGNGATRFYAPAYESGSLHTYLATVHGMVKIAVISIIFVAFVFISGLVFVGLSQWLWLACAALCFALLSGYNGILSGIQNAARQRAIVALHQGAASWGRFLIAAGLMLLLGATSTVAMWGYVVAMLLVLVSQKWFFRRIIKSTSSKNISKPEIDIQWRAQIFRYSWPFATWGVLSWGRTVADRWGLEFFSSTDDVGLYAVLFQLGYYPVAMLIGMSTTLLAPIYFQRAGDASDTRRLNDIFNLGWKVTLIAIAILLVVVVLTLFVHQQIFSLLVANEYAHISYLLPAMMLAAVLYESTRFLAIVLQAQNATQILIKPTNISHFISMLLIFLGALWDSLQGVVLAYIVQSFIPLIWLTLIFKRQHKLINLGVR